MWISFFHNIQPAIALQRRHDNVVGFAFARFVDCHDALLVRAGEKNTIKQAHVARNFSALLQHGDPLTEAARRPGG